jgi:hypothetical protein
MALIFLCYASEDKLRVEEVYHRLRAIDGFEPWMDKIDLLPGQRWKKEIPQALRNSDFILIFFSRNSVAKRGYVQREFKLALEVLQEIPENMIHTIPVRLDDCDLPIDFKFLHWCNLFEENDFERIVQSIKAGLSQRQYSSNKKSENLQIQSLLAPQAEGSSIHTSSSSEASISLPWISSSGADRHHDQGPFAHYEPKERNDLGKLIDITNRVISLVVLFVDDDTTACDFYESRFRSQTSLDIITANSLYKAKRIIENREINIDAVISDIYFNEYSSNIENEINDGIDFLRYVSENRLHISKYVLSYWHDRDIERKNALDKGVVVERWFPKVPQRPDDLKSPWVIIEKDLMTKLNLRKNTGLDHDM